MFDGVITGTPPPRGTDVPAGADLDGEVLFPGGRLAS
jgi:hypothetical protein